jgi:hypothetical protein
MDAATGLEGTDPERMHQELRTFVRTLGSWETLSARQLSCGRSALP